MTRNMKRYISILVTLVLCGLFSNDLYSQAGTGTVPEGTYTGASFLACAKNNSIKLKSNVTVTSTIEVVGTLTIDLDGYVLRGILSGDGGFVIHVNAGAKLTIKDSSPSRGHQGYLDNKGVFVWPHATGQEAVTVNGGIIYNRQIATKNTRGIYVEGTCDVERAKIVGCHAPSSFGAAVTIGSSGSFTMNGGEIRYNYAGNETYAGAIYGEPSHSNAGAMIKLSNTTLADNISVGNGGAICAFNLTLSKFIL